MNAVRTFFKVIFAFIYHNKVLKITFCFSKKMYNKMAAKASKSNYTRQIDCRVFAVKCSKNDY